MSAIAMQRPRWVRYLHQEAWLGIALLSLFLVGGTWLGQLPFSWLEVAGFITSLISVWQAVLNMPWTWATGNLGAAAYLIFFNQNKLYANAFLQFVYIVLGFWGWYQWLRGGKQQTARPITHILPRTAAALFIITPFCTYAASVFVGAIDGAAPLWDTFTTVLSLVATFVMGRRYIEHWFLWLVTDVIYVFRFVSRGLYLTAVLYAVFLLMCVRGYPEWRRQLKLQAAVKGAFA